MIGTVLDVIFGLIVAIVLFFAAWLGIDWLFGWGPSSVKGFLVVWGIILGAGLVAGICLVTTELKANLAARRKERQKQALLKEQQKQQALFPVSSSIGNTTYIISGEMKDQFPSGRQFFTKSKSGQIKKWTVASSTRITPTQNGMYGSYGRVFCGDATSIDVGKPVDKDVDYIYIK